MQIFEITQARKKVTEVSAVGGGASSFLQGLGAGLGSAGGAAGQIGQAIGTAATPNDPKFGSGTAETGMEISQQLAQGIAQNMQQAWNQVVKDWMTKNEVPSVAAADQTAQAALKFDLQQLVSKTMSGKRGLIDYRRLPEYVANDPVTQGTAKRVVDLIDSATDAILDVTSGKVKTDLRTEFLTLASKGVGPALNMIEFNAGAGQRELGPRVRVAPLTPDAQQMAKEVGINNNDISELQAYVQRLGDPNKAMAILKNIAGLPP